MTLNNNDALKKARSHLGLTQAELAEQLNHAMGRAYDNTTISRWESGREAVPDAVLAYVKDTMMKPTIVAVANNKGGVGKTTTVGNLAACLAWQGYRVGVVDADAQGNACMALGMNQLELHQQQKTLEHVLQRSPSAVDVNDALVKPYENSADLKHLDLWLLASSLYLNQLERSLQGQMSWETMLKSTLKDITLPLDYIIIDCPPTLGFMMANACVAADYVLIPCELGAFAVQGVEMVRQSLGEYRAAANPHLQVLGILPTRFDARLAEHQHQLDNLHAVFGVKAGQEELGGWHIYDPVPRRTAYEQADDSGMPLFLHYPTADQTAMYPVIAQDLAQRSGRKTKGGRK